MGATRLTVRPVGRPTALQHDNAHLERAVAGCSDDQMLAGMAAQRGDGGLAATYRGQGVWRVGVSGAACCGAAHLRARAAA